MPDQADETTDTTPAEQRDPDLRQTAAGEGTDEEAKTDEAPAASADDAGSDNAASDSASDEKSEEEKQREEEEKQRQAEEFAAEHDPAKHDIEAGEEFRQRGDWTAEKAGGPQVWDSEGNLVEGSEHEGTLTESEVVEAQNSDGGHGHEGHDGGHGDNGHGGQHFDGGADAPDGRRVSSLDEVVDGGYSVGSAAPIEDGAMPLGHPVKAWNDTKTFLAPGAGGYEGADPHVWFTDAGTAEAAGFRHAD